MTNSVPTKEKPKNDYFRRHTASKDLKKRAIRGGGITVASRTIDYAVHLCGTVILARILAPGDFGLIAMVTAITGFFLIFRDLGLTDATVQSETITRGQISTLFWINMGFSALITIAIIASSPAIAWFYSEPRLQNIAIVSSTSFVFAGLSAQHRALLRRNLLFHKIAFVEIAASVGSIAVSIGLALQGFGFWALVLRPVAIGVLTAAGMWIASGWIPGRPVRRSGVMSLVRFGANTMGFYFVNYFARNTDKTLVGWKSGAAALGFYHKAFHLFVAPINQLAIPLQGVAVATLTKLRNEPGKYRHYYIKAMSILAFIGMPMSTFMTAMSDDLILVILGPKWEKAAQIFSVLGFSAGVQILYSTQGWLYVSQGRADRWFRWGLFGSAFMVGSFFIGLLWGALGVAVAYTISLYLLIGPAISFAGKPMGLSFWNVFRGIWRYYVGAVLTAVSCWYISEILPITYPVLRLMVTFVIFVCLYLAMVTSFHWSFTPIKELLMLLLQMLPKKIQDKLTKGVDKSDNDTHTNANPG